MNKISRCFVCNNRLNKRHVETATHLLDKLHGLDDVGRVMVRALKHLRGDGISCTCKRMKRGQKCLICSLVNAIDFCGLCPDCGHIKQTIGCRFNDDCWECYVCGVIYHLCNKFSRKKLAVK